MSYTGGAFGTMIPDSYAFDDFTEDLEIAAPLVIAMSAGGDLKDFADVIARMLLRNEQISDAFGRMTAYADRNGLDEIFGYETENER